jgi:hypothetical protein
MKEVITGYGHPHITSKHPTTLEFTKDEEIGYEAHCIIAVKADKGCSDLSKDLKGAIKEGKRLDITIKVGSLSERMVAFGHPDLMLENDKDVVLRKSGWVDERTLCVHSSKASSDLDRELVKKLQDPKQKVEMIIEF